MDDFINEHYTETDLSLLKKLTLIIPTHNRNYYLSRCLWYHAHFPFGHIIVADSSSEEKKVVNQETVAKIHEMFGADVLYLEYEPETEKYGGDIYRKWGDAVQHVETEYSQICTDKEFLIPSTVEMCVHYLEENPTVSFCEGKYYYLESPKPGKYTCRNMYPSKISLLQNDALERLKFAENGKNRTSTLLGLRRANFHKDLYRTMMEHNINDIRFGEFTPEFLTIIRSPTMYIENPYCYRDITQLVPKKVFRKTDSSSLRYPFLNTYITDGIYDKYFDRFVNTLSPEISDHSKCSLEDAERYVKTNLPAVLRMRGFYGNEKVTEDPLWYLWRKSPYFIKRVGGVIIPKKYLDYSHVKTPEELAIVKILESTKEHYDLDKPII